MLDKSLLSENLLLIGEERRRGTGKLVTRHYAGTGEALREVCMASVADLNDAVAAACAARAKWVGLAPAVRRDMLLAAASLLKQRSEHLAFLGAVDAGIPVATVRAFVTHAAEWLSYYAGWIDKAGGHLVPADGSAMNYVRPEPYGVVGVISPSNSTVSAMILGPLLAAGNCAVVKTSEFTSNVMVEYLQVFLDAGLPPGVVNCVPGEGDIGEALVAHPQVEKIHFTGSCAVGARVGAQAAALLKPVGMELGGKSANIVFADANIDLAADVAMRALVRQSGQSCVAGTRVIAHESIMDELVAATVARTQAQKIGDPLSNDTAVGPVISAPARQRILGFIQNAVDAGQGRLVLGGGAPASLPAQGYYVSPTIFSEVDNASSLAQTEIFGPVISFIPFASEQEALELANASEYGLAGYIHTQNLSLAHRAAAALDVGIIWVNGAAGVLPGGPFGGVKHSGFGRVGGQAGLDEFTRQKNVWLAL